MVKTKKFLFVIFFVGLCFANFVHSMLQPSMPRLFVQSVLVLSQFSLFNNLIYNKDICKQNYMWLHGQQKKMPYNNLLSYADMQLKDVELHLRRCNMLYRDELFIKEMIKNPSLEKHVQDLRQELDGERSKLETFILIVKKMQRPGPLD